MKVEIEGIEVTTETHYLDPVTYVPKHALGNAQHEDAEQGVIMEITENGIRVLYSTTRTVQLTHANELVWG